MPSFENLKEEIREVYRIFDEDEAGNMSMSELARALFTITGERLPRSVLRKLVLAARESLAQRTAAESGDVTAGDGRGSATEPETQSNQSSAASSPTFASGASRSRGRTNSSFSSVRTVQTRTTNNMTAAAAEEGIDIATFEEIVLRKLNARNADEEMAYTFALLEDQYYPGFITKESLQRAAMEAEEPLTQAELAEMFDSLVTGAPTAAVDLVTFRHVQEAALKAHGADAQDPLPVADSSDAVTATTAREAAGQRAQEDATSAEVNGTGIRLEEGMPASDATCPHATAVPSYSH